MARSPWPSPGESRYTRITCVLRRASVTSPVLFDRLAERQPTHCDDTSRFQRLQSPVGSNVYKQRLRSKLQAVFAKRTTLFGAHIPLIHSIHCWRDAVVTVIFISAICFWILLNKFSTFVAFLVYCRTCRKVWLTCCFSIAESIGQIRISNSWNRDRDWYEDKPLRYSHWRRWKCKDDRTDSSWCSNQVRMDAGYGIDSEYSEC